MSFRVERWRVQPAQLPRPWRHCPGCHMAREFVSSERFRVNAQKKVIDVWLIYRCSACEATWNFPVVSRCNVTNIDPSLRDGYERNDRGLASRHAFDLTTLRSYASRVEMQGPPRIERSTSNATSLIGHTILLEVVCGCEIRLERLLATELAISRNALMRRHAAGGVVVTPTLSDALRRRVRNGQAICFVGGLFDGTPVTRASCV